MMLRKPIHTGWCSISTAARGHRREQERWNLYGWTCLNFCKPQAGAFEKYESQKMGLSRKPNTPIGISAYDNEQHQSSTYNINAREHTIQATTKCRVVMNGNSSHISSEFPINRTLNSSVLDATVTRHQQEDSCSIQISQLTLYYPT